MKTATKFGPRKTFHVGVKDTQWGCLQETPVFDHKTSSNHTVLFVSFLDANILSRQRSRCVFDPHWQLRHLDTFIFRSAITVPLVSILDMPENLTTRD